MILFRIHCNILNGNFIYSYVVSHDVQAELGEPLITGDSYPKTTNKPVQTVKIPTFTFILQGPSTAFNHIKVIIVFQIRSSSMTQVPFPSNLGINIHSNKKGKKKKKIQLYSDGRKQCNDSTMNGLRWKLLDFTILMGFPAVEGHSML